MTKSFPEIAQEIVELAGQFAAATLVYGLGKTETMVMSEEELQDAIEAILHREFGDSNGSALERKVGAITASESEIAP